MKQLPSLLRESVNKINRVCISLERPVQERRHSSMISLRVDIKSRYVNCVRMRAEEIKDLARQTREDSKDDEKTMYAQCS
jgi:hypothetical protein